MRWLAALAVGLLLTACGGADSPSSASQEGAATSAADTKVADIAAQAGSAESESKPDTPDDKVTAVSETDDDAPDTDTASTIESLKLATMPGPLSVPGFKEGVHFLRLVPVQPTNAAIGTVQVSEVFSYGCKPCFDIDAKVDAWRAKHKPAYVSFERLPTSADAVQKAHARAYYVLEQLDRLDVLHPKLFAEIQDGASMMDASALSKFLSAHEVDQRAIAAAIKAKQLDAKIQRASDLQRRYRVDSLPYFVVGGKFVTTVAMAGDDDRLLTLLTQLSIREHEF